MPLLSSALDSWSATELRRLQASAEWSEQRRLRALKAGDEWQRRQAGKQASYGRWSMMRDVSSQQRWRLDADSQREQRADDDSGGAHYWQWHDDGQQRQQPHGPQFAWQRNQSQYGGLPAGVVQAGEVLGLPRLSLTAPVTAAAAVTAVWSVADIKAAFKRRALLTHPDMPNGDQHAFQTTAKAYDTLIAYVYQQQPI